MSPRIHSQVGATLLEALIAMLVFLLGLVGVVGIQAASVRNTVDSQHRIVASELGDQLLGMMWADRNQLPAYAMTGSQTCTPGATEPKARWVCAVQAGLPGATGTNSPRVDVGADGAVRILIRWRRQADEPVRELVVSSQVRDS